MKKLYFIGGTMGIGKTTVAELLKVNLTKCVFLDGDWCWDMDPFVVNDETKKMVIENICYLLNQYLKCSVYENIVFCWVMHEQSIIDDIFNRLHLQNCEVKNISLICDEKHLIQRLHKDIDEGIRNQSIIVDSVKRLPLYNNLNTIKIDTTHCTPKEVCDKIMSL